jgi:hypothetical protein
MASQMPQWVMVVDAGTLMVTCVPVTDAAETVPHVVATRAYVPPATSLAPVVPGVAVCRLMKWAFFWFVPEPTSELSVWFSSATVAENADNAMYLFPKLLA